MGHAADWHLTFDVVDEIGRGDPFAATMLATHMPMVITDPQRHDNPVVFVNRAFQDLTGYPRDEVIGRNCRFLQGPETDMAAVGRLRCAISAGASMQIDILNYRKDGSTFWNALYVSPTRDEEGTVRLYFACQLDVSDRIASQRLVTEQKATVEAEVHERTAALREALEAKTLLLHEVDHRVKNNLTMIGSLLRLQSRQIGDPAMSAKLDSMLERVDALATVHRRLHQSDDVTRFDVGAFTADLVSDVVGASVRTDIAVRAEVERLDIPSSNASALGLIINEIVTNAVKHAFADGRPGSLEVWAEAVDGRAIIRIADDGPGMSKAELLVDGLGRMLIARLSRQVGDTTTWGHDGPGTSVSISLPLGA